MKKLLMPIVIVFGLIEGSGLYALMNPFAYTKKQIKRAIACRPTKPNPRCTPEDKKFANRFWGGAISAGAMAILAGLGVTAYVVQNEAAAAYKKEAGNAVGEIAQNLKESRQEEEKTMRQMQVFRIKESIRILQSELDDAKRAVLYYQEELSRAAQLGERYHASIKYSLDQAISQVNEKFQALVTKHQELAALGELI